jgi:hypothetical protein
MKPTKGVKPKFDGVIGALVTEAPDGVLFGQKLRQSPYDPLLKQLRDAGAGKFLRFESLRAKPSIAARAKKLGIRVLFGEQGDVLWVTLAAADLRTDGAAEQPTRKTNSDLVLEGLDAKRDTAGALTTWLRSNGAPGIGISQVDELLRQLARAGKIRLKKNQGHDGDRWERKPNA